MAKSTKPQRKVKVASPVRRSLELPFEARPTEIPPDSPHALDAMERAARYLTGDAGTPIK